MPNSRPPASIWTHEPLLTPERKVWRAVLGQAYADCELPMFLDGTEPMERVLARRFLRAAGAEEAEILGLVCGFAEVPADRVILWARQRYPAGQRSERGAECGSAAADFSEAETMATPEMRELCCRTPQNAVLAAAGTVQVSLNEN